MHADLNQKSISLASATVSGFSPSLAAASTSSCRHKTRDRRHEVARWVRHLSTCGLAYPVLWGSNTYKWRYIQVRMHCVVATTKTFSPNCWRGWDTYLTTLALPFLLPEKTFSMFAEELPVADIYLQVLRHSRRSNIHLGDFSDDFYGPISSLDQ